MRYKFLEVKAEPIQFGISISWVVEGLGFGTVDLITNSDGGIDVYSEHMSREFVQALIAEVIKKAIIINE